ncbi:DUF1292 domain-containing protein [Paenibacillus antri]|uniref:DUF1292 domain-containing protein n=1 Tax=Paenibacillus antri TaxID=2582848 RepID=A0A5R9G692_9BACL|nr:MULTISPECIES: DUF1292 domain-containing protein [Paenibacillus]TLS48283.1 DUF1292 domain-containing protein [Paenibacillus antri]
MTDQDRAAAGEEEESVYVVTDENGVERELVPVYTFDYEENEYVVLIDRNDAEADGLILRIEQDGDEVVLANIEDDDEWNAVLDIYNELLEEEEEEQ